MTRSAYLVKTRGGYVAEVYDSAAFITAGSVDGAKAYGSMAEAREVCEMLNAQAVVEVAEDNRREWRNVYKRRKRKAEDTE